MLVKCFTLFVTNSRLLTNKIFYCDRYNFVTYCQKYACHRYNKIFYINVKNNNSIITNDYSLSVAY